MMDQTYRICRQIAVSRLTQLVTDEGERLLGATCLGDRTTSPQGTLAAMPLQHIWTPVVGDAAAMAEAWFSPGPCRSGEHQGIRFRTDEHLLFGVLEVHEADFPAAPGAPPLQQAAEAAYGRIFRLLDETGYSHLWRTWNYLADINAESHGLERYRQFNSGRQEAFIAAGRLSGTASDAIPAACALGSAGGPLSIAFLAARNAPLAIENRRQISAYDYPREYGPRSPTFSRAVLAQLPGVELFLLSGTASIVGHRTTHRGDVIGQTRETLANIAVVLEEANRVSRTGPYRLEELSYRVYLRHPTDLGRVRPVIEQVLGADAAVSYVQADVCRTDLLIEIEAMASHPKNAG